MTEGSASNVKDKMPATTQEDTGAPKKPREKIMRADKVWHKKSSKFVYVKTSTPKSTDRKFGRYAVTVIRRLSTQRTFDGQYIVELRGQHIAEALSDVFNRAENLNFSKSSRVITLRTEKLKLLYHALPRLTKMLKDEKDSGVPDQDKIFELEAVVEFTNEHFEGTITACRELLHHQTDFSFMWSLFPPFSLAYTLDGLGETQVFRVRNSQYHENVRDKTVSFIVEVDYVDVLGERVGYVRPQERSIPQFFGCIPIHDLQIIPLHLNPSYPRILATLESRGERLLGMGGRPLLEYKGHALEENNKRFNSHGRVIIDPTTFHRTHPQSSMHPAILSSLPINQLTSEQKILLSSRINGFSLGDKTWGAFAVSRLNEVTWNDDVIESLVLNERKKKFIRALIRNHCNKSDDGGFDGFVRDKGRGLVGLLAGPPGVGKTMTAEAVAEIAHRPLYTVSAGELGETSGAVHQKLTKVFELAETWRAVVLLDEADVFLTERSDQNLTQNAITSIFLQQLEYYQGILLLTTNRIESCDGAFQSRIHFCFKYEDLTADARKSIWQAFFRKVEETTEVKIAVEEADLVELSGLELNGRHIKNIVSIAQAASTEGSQPLDLECIRLAIEFAHTSWGEYDKR